MTAPVLLAVAVEEEGIVRDAVAQIRRAREDALALLFVAPATQAGAGAGAVIDVMDLSSDGADTRIPAVLGAQQRAYCAHRSLGVDPGLRRERIAEAPALRWLAVVLQWAYKVRPPKITTRGTE